MLLALPRLGYMPARCLADMAWALASFGARPNDGWSARLARAAASRARAGEFERGDLAVVVWALGRWGYVPGAELAGLSLD